MLVTHTGSLHTNGAEGNQRMPDEKITQMILDELREQRLDIKQVRSDVGDLKGDVKHLKDGQDDITARLQKLEETSQKASNLDWKSIARIVAIIGVIVIGASKGIPADVWSALAKLMGAG